jgi:hypothetical protein
MLDFAYFFTLYLLLRYFFSEAVFFACPPCHLLFFLKTLPMEYERSSYVNTRVGMPPDILVFHHVERI